jgi:hypothetical protein
LPNYLRRLNGQPGSGSPEKADEIVRQDRFELRFLGS